jgi:hypothetical protein
MNNNQVNQQNQTPRLRRILMFSRKCQSSSNLILLLRNLNILMNFEMVCIDDIIAQKKPLPPFLKTVPALVLPEINGVFQGREAFEWVDKLRQSTIKMNMLKSQQMMGPAGFVTTEMNGFSDNFAYTSTDVPQPKSFLPYGEDDKYGIYTGHEGTKISDEELKKQISQIENNRKDQEKQLSTIIEQNRANSILEYEKQKMYGQEN